MDIDDGHRWRKITNVESLEMILNTYLVSTNRHGLMIICCLIPYSPPHVYYLLQSIITVILVKLAYNIKLGKSYWKRIKISNHHLKFCAISFSAILFDLRINFCNQDCFFHCHISVRWRKIDANDRMLYPFKAVKTAREYHIDLWILHS